MIVLMSLNLFGHLHEVNFMIWIVFTTEQKLFWLFSNFFWSNQVFSLLDLFFLYFFILILNFNSRLYEIFLDAIHQIENQLLSSLKRIFFFFDLCYFFNRKFFLHGSEINRNTLQLALLVLKLNIKLKSFSFTETLLFN